MFQQDSRRKKEREIQLEIMEKTPIDVNRIIVKFKWSNLYFI